jgi:hypothetical protein
MLSSPDRIRDRLEAGINGGHRLGPPPFLVSIEGAVANEVEIVSLAGSKKDISVLS